MAKLKVLYFIQTSKPTNYDKQVAVYTGQTVAFRNAALVKPNDPVEPCDAVMGAPIPSQYSGVNVYGSVKAANSNAIPAAPLVFDEAAAIAEAVANIEAAKVAAGAK
jgi:hypothetical protein